MPWNVKNAVELRLELVKRAQDGEPIAGLCREFGVTRRTAYKWISRYEQSGTVNALFDQSKKPIHCPHQTDERVEDRVCELRRKYGWGGRKLQVLLERENIALPVVTINRIIKRNGLLALEDCHKPAPLRFQRESPNELWQGDFKGPMGRGSARCEPLSIIDDYSRYVIALEAVKDKGTETVRRAFIKAFEEHGIPDAFLLDHGVPWWGNSHYLGFTQFSVWLMNQNIKLIYSGFCHPQTQGKVERFHRSLQLSVATKGTPCRFPEWIPLFSEIRQEFNNIRPHESLNMKVPQQLYRKSKQQYSSKQKPFEYPADSSVYRLDSHGCFIYNEKRVFVSQALADQYVCIEELDLSTVVYYRNSLVREIREEGYSNFIHPPGAWNHKPPSGLNNYKNMKRTPT